MPPVPQDLVRIHLNFSLGNEEIAVSTFHLRLKHISGAPTNWPEMTQDAAVKVLDKFRSGFGAGPQNLFPAAVKLRDVAAYHLNAADGHTLDKGTAIAAGATAWAGQADKSLPFECALAVSLFGYDVGQFVADRARRRGRMYFPPLANTVMDSSPGYDGRITTGARDQLRNAAGVFFNDVQNMSVGQDPLDLGQSWELVVVSRAGNFTTRVSRVSVGDVMDVQRRRRNNQPERYAHANITDS